MNARVLICVLLLCARPLAAQRTDSAASYSSSFAANQPSACMATLATSHMSRVPVFLDAQVVENIDSALTPQADLMAQDVATEMRSVLGAKGSELPRADRTVAWYGVPSELIVVARADGSITRRAMSVTGDTSGPALISRALDSARARGTAAIVWPQHFKADSIIVRLSLNSRAPEAGVRYPSVDSVRRRFLVFDLAQPPSTPAVMAPNQGEAHYPTFNDQSRITGNVVLEFIVDSSGRVERGSVHDIWNAGRPRLTGELGRYYGDFVRAAADWVQRSRFAPARFGPCPVRQISLVVVDFVTQESERAAAMKRETP